MEQFDDIRSFRDDEIEGAVKELLADEKFQTIIQRITSSEEEALKFREIMSSIKDIEALQTSISLRLLQNIEKMSSEGVSYSVMEEMSPDKNYLFISNHRDIILDPGFLNLIMHRIGLKKTGIAIGDNLLIYRWIELAVRANRAFIVKRDLKPKEQLLASKELSEYIRNDIANRDESVWIAQREGRTKDGFDKIQPAILKMMNMSNKTGNIVDGFRELNIVPMAISYEIEPCGIAKVEELLNRKYNPDFSKTWSDDLRSMGYGIKMQKGHVHFGIGYPLNHRIDEITAGKTGNECIAAIAEYLDKRIYFNYKLWPNNYIAADIIKGETTRAEHYTNEDKDKFVEMMEREVKTLKFDYNEVRDMYLAMYANPVFNHEKYFG